MPIFPLPQFEADLAEYRLDKEAYEKLSVPKTVVVRFGFMKMIGEFPFDLSVKPGCGTKMVARTHRGTEVVEMLTSTCPNAGCSKSVTRKEMLEYIENSGGKDYPYFNEGKILRIVTVEDLNEQRRADALRPAMKHFAQQAADTLGLKVRIVEVEPILGRERLTFYFTADDRVDFRDLVVSLSREYSTRIDLRQVGARDEARLIADYEKCGQHCCCKQFLKVLKPISMKAAKIQKATLDPLKISGRCGRLMCCLRYEDETYDTLRKRLPRMKARVQTPEGVGTVVDAQILTQLVLVVLDGSEKRVAVPVENISPVGAPPTRQAKGDDPEGDAPGEDPLRGMSAERVQSRVAPEPRSQGPGQARQDDYRRRSERESGAPRRDDRRGPTPDQRRHDRAGQPTRAGQGSDIDRRSPNEPSDTRPDITGRHTDGLPSEQPPRDGRKRRRRRRRGGGPGQRGRPDAGPPTQPPPA